MKYVILKGGNIGSRRELYDAVEAHLTVPDYFGRNLDALQEVLLLDLLPKGPLTIEIEDYDEMKAKMGDYAVGLRRMLSDTARIDPRLTVIFR